MKSGSPFLILYGVLVTIAGPALAQPLAPAPAPHTESVAARRCLTCPAPTPSSPSTLNLSVLVVTDVAQFYAYTAEGAILVYFVARATFSHAPSQLQLADFDVGNGSVLEIVAENPCTQFLLKGAVQQQEAWLGNTTKIMVSAKAGATTDCQGAAFTAASASSVAIDGPIGSMYVPDMAYTAAGPITNAATNFVRLAFSEPILGLSINALNVTLTASADNITTPPAAADSYSNSNLRRLSQAVSSPALLPDCVPAYQIQAVPAVTNSTQFYNVYITLPDCFYGLVNIEFTGQVTNAAGATSLPIKGVGFNRVATNIPVMGLTAYEALPTLGQNLNGTCT